ncbi:MAG: glycine cleavage system protein H, partial [Planctomycetota bacterium]
SSKNTEFAVKALSDLVYVDMPEIEDLTERGHPYAEIESVKAVADVNAPLSGEVAEINETLVENLDDLSNDPFGKGWIAKIKISYPEELKDLMSAEDYEVHLKQEAKKH